MWGERSVACLPLILPLAWIFQGHREHNGNSKINPPNARRTRVQNAKLRSGKEVVPD
jgi:hypothetical protein